MKLLYFFALTLFFHGENVATYTITKDGNTLNISAKMDASDISKCLKSSPTKSQNYLKTYFKEHLKFEVNGITAPLILTNYELKGHHAIVEFTLDGTFENVSHLKIHNTLLFNVNQKQSNVIALRFGGMVRDFLINKERPTLNINL